MSNLRKHLKLIVLVGMFKIKKKKNCPDPHGHKSKVYLIFFLSQFMITNLMKIYSNVI